MKNLEKNEMLIATLQRCAASCHDFLNNSLENGAPDQPSVCLRLALDCAGVCEQTAAFLARGSAYAGQISALCLEICSATAQEMSLHLSRDACRLCAEACRDCADNLSNLKIPAVQLADDAN